MPLILAPSRTVEIVSPEWLFSMHWGTLRLGEITLKKGKTRLTIQPQSKPGARVMDLKEVELRRID